MNLCFPIILCLGFSAEVLCTATAQETSHSNASTKADAAAKKSLGKTGWYDPEQDAVVPIQVRESQVDEANRQSRWNPSAKKAKPVATPTAPAAAPMTGFGGGGFSGVIVSYWFVGLLCVVILAIMVYVYMTMEPSSATAGKSEKQDDAEGSNLASKLEQLPIKVSLGQSDLLSEAMQLANRGRFDLAIIYLFGHTLILLDRKHRIRLSHGKTNRQYLREVGSSSSLHPPTSDIVQTFEASYFGGHSPQASRFEECVQKFREIERELARAATVALIALVCLTFSGCGSGLNKTYGRTEGTFATNSINGLSGIRGMFAEYGWEARDDSLLSKRLDKAKVLFWAPPDQVKANPAITTWFEEWLAASDDRTLIYVADQYDATWEYWRDIIPVAPPKQRLTCRREYAREVNALEVETRSPEIIVEWFSTSHQDLLEERNIQGPWAPKPSGTAAPKMMTMHGIAQSTTSTSTNTIQFKPLISDNQGNVFTAELTSPKWRRSKVIVISDASWLVNYGLTKPTGRQLADQLITSAGTPGRIVFLESMTGLRIREKEGEVSRPGGMELLMQSPFNMISIHGALIGAFILLGLAPILGRPKKLKSLTRTDFGRHLTALGELLQRTGDHRYAKRLISDYFSQVRGEPDSQWVIAPVVVAKNESVENKVANPAVFRGPFFSLADQPDPNPLKPSKPGESP